MTGARRLGWGRALVGALVAVVLLTVAATAWQGWRSGERARLLRHQLVAERLFDSMERELTTLISNEESRPFVQYRPLDGMLDQRPDYVVGWFQVDPEGSFSVAHPIDEGGRTRLAHAAEDLDGWGSDQADEGALTVTMKVPVDVPSRPVAAARTVPSSKTPRKKTDSIAQNKAVDNLDDTLLPPEVQLNNSALPRAERVEQRQAVNRAEFEQFVQQVAPEPTDPEPADPADPGRIQPDGAAPPRGSQRVWVPVQVQVPERAPAEVVDVVVSPLTLDEGPDADSLVLHRTVSLDGRTWVQGLLLQVGPLQRTLVSQALAGTELAPSVTVGWDNEGSSGGIYAFEHDFAPPFESFHATAGLGPLPEATGTADGLVWLTVALLLLLAGLGLVAVYRLLVLSVRHAEQREDFVSAVSHELKSPLTSIRMYSEMLEQGMVADPEQRHGYYGTIRTEAERLSRLVDDVLAFSRLDRGLPVAEGQTGELGAVVDDVTRLMSPQFAAAGASVAVDIDPQVRPVSVDRDALSQVLTNLLDNALKFSADAEEQRIDLHIREDGGRAMIRVRDRGPGVPPALLRRMFEPFVRGERELTRRTKGTGIGLALVRQLIEHLDGTVVARNHPDGGLEVCIHLPAR